MYLKRNWKVVDDVLEQVTLRALTSEIQRAKGSAAVDDCAALQANAESGTARGIEAMRELFCDNYCKYPLICKTQDEMDGICEECLLSKLAEMVNK